MDHTYYMRRCIELAGVALGHVAPNPLVGSVFVWNGKIISEGYHKAFGMPHAEVHALEQLNDSQVLSEGTLYVNLEPCSHFGKTPPCADLIIQKGVKKVVIANIDPFEEVNGNGIHKLKDAGIEVISGILEDEAKFLNRRFFTFHQKNRPYIILKWAHSKDGFIGKNEPGQFAISNASSKILVHQWRSQEQAILVGSNTAMVDNPQLTTRNFAGKNPLRIVIDANLSLPPHLHLMDGSVPTLVINSVKSAHQKNLEHIKINRDENFLPNLMSELKHRKIQSVMVEGGAKILNLFLDASLWDECRVFQSPQKIFEGVAAPVLKLSPDSQSNISGDILSIYRNEKSI